MRAPTVYSYQMRSNVKTTTITIPATTATATTTSTTKQQHFCALLPLLFYFVPCLDQTLWYHFVARSSSSQQHGAEENVCTPRMETTVAPLCSQASDVKIQRKGVSRHYLTPEMIVAKSMRHHLVAAFCCSANIYDNICPGTIYENDTHNLYV